MPKKRKDDRIRNWTIIVYPESAPKNWREILDDMHIAWIESPCHDKDTNPDGTKKKPHWHIVLVFEGKKSFEQIKEISDKLNSPVPQKVESLRGMIRYLIHQDNPEKYQYSRNEIKNHGVDDLEKYFETASSQRRTLKEIVEFIQENHVIHLTDLTAYALDKDDWFDVITNRNTLFLTALIKSEWQKAQRNVQGTHTSYNSAQISKDNMPISIAEMELSEKIEFLLQHDYKADRDLVQYLIAQGFKQKDIADALGVNRKTIYRWLKK